MTEHDANVTAVSSGQTTTEAARPTTEQNTSAASHQSNEKPRALDPRIKMVWRISGAVTPIIVCAALAILLKVIPAVSTWPFGAYYPAILLVIFVIWMAITVGFFPAFHYAQWRFKISPEFLEVQHGIFWRKHTVIPFIRVQNTDTQQGPLLRLFGLSQVTVSTASGQSVIPGLATAEADALRDKAAELARIAREDV